MNGALSITGATQREAMELLEAYAQECEANADTQLRMGQYDRSRRWQETAFAARRTIQKMQDESGA